VGITLGNGWFGCEGRKGTCQEGAVEAAATGHWRCAVWAPESRCVVLLCEHDVLLVVEL
jgi:hypothetical protein